LAFLLPRWEPYKTIGRRTPPIRDYEIMFIVEPTLSDNDIGTIQERLRELAVSRGAEVKKLAVWERRRMAYPIKGRRDGIYILAELRANPSVVKELEQQLSVTENVLRHMVVRLDED
jgi:small subunit ribosomal protein S6